MEGNRLIATKKIIVVSRQGCENQVENIKQWASKKGIDRGGWDISRGGKDIFT